MWLGEVAAAGLGLHWEDLNILEMSPMEACLVGGALAFAMAEVGAGGRPKAAQSCATRWLRKERCTPREKGYTGKEERLIKLNLVVTISVVGEGKGGRGGEEDKEQGDIGGRDGMAGERGR